MTRHPVIDLRTPPAEPELPVDPYLDPHSPDYDPTAIGDPVTTPDDGVDTHETHREPEPPKLERIGFFERRQVIFAIGRLAAKHNRKTADTFTEDGTYVTPVSISERANQRRYLKDEMSALNQERRRILWDKVKRFGFSSPDIDARTKSHAARRQKLLDLGSIAAGHTRSGSAIPGRVARRTVSNTAIRNANPGPGDTRVIYTRDGEDVETFIPKHIMDRSKAIRSVPDSYTKQARRTGEITSDKLPRPFTTQEGIKAIREIRVRLYDSLEIARREAAARGEEFDLPAARARIMKNLTFSHYRRGQTDDFLGLHEKKNAALLNRIVQMDQEKFNTLFPIPKPEKRRRPMVTSDGSVIMVDSEGRDEATSRFVSPTYLRETPVGERTLLDEHFPHLLSEDAISKLYQDIKDKIDAEREDRLIKAGVSVLPKDEHAEMTNHIRETHLNKIFESEPSLPDFVKSEIRERHDRKVAEMRRAARTT